MGQWHQHHEGMGQDSPDPTLTTSFIKEERLEPTLKCGEGVYSKDYITHEPHRPLPW